jgi:hypothetical protein
LLLFFDVALEYVINKVQENQLGLKFSGTHQLLVSACEVNLLRDNINTKQAQKLRFTLVRRWA